MEQETLEQYIQMQIIFNVMDRTLNELNTTIGQLVDVM